MYVIAIMCKILLICFKTIMRIIASIAIIAYCFVVGWLKSVGSRVVYELDEASKCVTARNLSVMLFPFRVSWANFLCQ